MNVEKLFDALSKILSEKKDANIKFTVKKRGDVNVMCKAVSTSK